MSHKSIATKSKILDHAIQQASFLGLEGISIGQLASELQLSKSGLFAHFQSKEELQIQLLQTASEAFTERVIRPALSAPRGVPRLTALFEAWINWAQASESQRGGCLFVAASVEFDDRPGHVRDTLVRIQRNWNHILQRTVELGVEAGTLRPDLEPAQVAQEMYGIMLAFHFYYRLLQEQRAKSHALTSFSHLVQRIGLNP